MRAVYRAAVCSRLPIGADACDDVLLRLPGEGEGGAAPVVGNAAARYRIAFVPGFFSECFGEVGEPFRDVVPTLEAEGFQVDLLDVPGRGTSAGNARRIAEHFARGAGGQPPVIVFAYSKGLPDVLEFLAGHPDAGRQVAAVVSVAGAANGSPLAGRVEGAYRWLGARLPLPGCERGSGEEIRDLRRDVRLEWWRRYGNSLSVPIFALVAAPRPERVSAITRFSYERLATVDPRNDGKLLWTDQIAPRSHLLGYANADHYAIAIPLSESLPVLSPAFHDDVPRAALVRAAIDVVAATLRDRAR
ncbi:hypothetical protein M6I34_06115 [Burkholderiaceae bacterium FT117]|uniref:hypothetical protein n=1 Tax=Zeimonas sediminis TaxID=2944268 RepID=UPI00234317CE|nr:hypothetical protein [Zeimonas sediminis]MCM5570076.1 hypothetical protein [Zeimonas sediminis]